MSVAGCRECMGSVPQDNSQGGNATQGCLAAVFHAMEDNIPPMGSTSPSTQNEKKRRRASSGASNLPRTCGPKVARVTRKAKGKQVHKAGLWGAHPRFSEEIFDKSFQEGSIWEEEACTCTVDLVQHFADDTHCLLQAQTMVIQKSTKMSLRL